MPWATQVSLKKEQGLTIYSNGLYFNVGVSVLGPIEFKMGGNGLGKLWLLQVDCLVTSAISLTLIEDCSSAAFLSALETHSRRNRYPAHVTTDSGSQLKAGLKRLTRSSPAVPVTDEVLADDLETMLKAAQKGMNSVKFHIAQSNSQSINGLSEANTGSAKKILKSLIFSIQ